MRIYSQNMLQKITLASLQEVMGTMEELESQLEEKEQALVAATSAPAPEVCDFTCLKSADVSTVMAYTLPGCEAGIPMCMLPAPVHSA